MVPDPFIFSDRHHNVIYEQGKSFNVGIIGRVTLTKGIELLLLLLDEISHRGAGDTFTFHLFGELSKDLPSAVISRLQNNSNVVLHGYVKGTENIYDKLHAVMHLSRVEALGRIFFESVDHGLPFIGLKAAGIGEIADLYQYNELMVKSGTDIEIAKGLFDALTALVNKYHVHKDCILKLKSKMAVNMSVKDYSSKIDKILNDH
nr:glycosyltransferase [Longitalea arenae]